MVRAVILDVDGTLMDTNYQHVEAWARAFLEVGVRPPRRDIHRQIGKGADLLVPLFVEDEGARQRAEDLHDEIYAQMSGYAYPLPGAPELISSLCEQGCSVWLATSAKPQELEQHLKYLGGRERLGGIVTSSEVENSKPAPDIFALALERTGVEASEAVALGDSVWDVQSALAAGIRTDAVLTGGAFGARELEQTGASRVYEDCARAIEEGFPGGA